MDWKTTYIVIPNLVANNYHWDLNQKKLTIGTIWDNGENNSQNH